MLFQIFFGAFVRWRDPQKIREAPPLYKMVATPHNGIQFLFADWLVGQIHQWLGRAVFMLGLAQIPLGLYVYGSPKTLFILYAICTFLFLTAWFVLEYLKNRKWFEHRYGSVRGIPTPIPEMSEHQPSEHRRTPDVENGYTPVGMDETPLQTPKRSRFSKLSWFGNRRSSGRQTHDTIGIPYQYDTATMDSSRVPSAQSPAIGGLAPGPGRKQEIIPPVPALPTHYEQHHSSGSLPSEEFRQRYGNPSALKDTVLRDSTTLGPPRGGGQPQQQQEIINMPEPRIPQSPAEYGQIAPMFGATPRSSGHSHNTHQSYQNSPGNFDQMPVSPLLGDGYIEADNGFVPTPADDSPRRPLPLPPHRRERSNDSSVNRLPIVDSPGASSAGEGQTIMVGGETNAGGQQPQVAVQVKLNPDGKSVTVRRLRPEEAEAERRERSRARQDRALQRELELERERQFRRSQSNERRSGDRRRSRQPENIERQEQRVQRVQLLDDGIRTPGSGSYTPSIGGQSSTIAGASGGLLGRVPEPQTPSNEQTPLNAMSPLVGMHPVTRSPAPPNGLSQSQRASVTSGGTTAENSEIEQEIVKEQRRKKRREERAGTASQLGGGDGGYYGPQGPESQWT